MRRSFTSLLVFVVLIWTLMYFFTLPSLNVYRTRLHSLSHFTQSSSSSLPPLFPFYARPKLKPSSPPTFAPTQTAPSPLPASLSSSQILIPKVPVMDQLPPRYLGKNRSFNHPLWQKFPVPRLVNFPENGRLLKEALANGEDKKNRVFSIADTGSYNVRSPIPFPADCPFKCAFEGGSDAMILGEPGMCSRSRLSFIFGLESSAHSWWAQPGVYENCAFTMRSNLDATVPMLGQLKSFLPVDLDTGFLPWENLPWIPYEVKKKRNWLSAMISNCETTRLEVFNKLGTLGVSLAQYGNCGGAPKGEPIPYDELDVVQAGILKQLTGGRFLEKESLIASSLFHFAAENSLCDFYHTEKLFGALKAGTVPIYFGARTIYPYLPEKSVLFVYDYDNVFELAKHLKELATNETAYNEYLAWRKKPLAEPLMDLLVVGHGERSAEWQCDLCKLVATTPPGSYEHNYDDCEGFPLAQFFDPQFRLTEYVKTDMQKDKPGGRRW